MNFVWHGLHRLFGKKWNWNLFLVTSVLLPTSRTQLIIIWTQRSDIYLSDSQTTVLHCSAVLSCCSLIYLTPPHSWTLSCQPPSHIFFFFAIKSNTSLTFFKCVFYVISLVWIFRSDIAGLWGFYTCEYFIDTGNYPVTINHQFMLPGKAYESNYSTLFTNGLSEFVQFFPFWKVKKVIMVLTRIF